MKHFWWSRLAWLLPTYLGVLFLVVLVMHLAPGDAATALSFEPGETRASAYDVHAREARLRAEHLLDQPVWKQFLHHLGPFDLSARGHAWFGGSGERSFGGLVLFDFGREFARPEVEVADELCARLALTLPISFLAILLSYAIAVPLGLWAALAKDGRLDRWVGAVAMLLTATPTFWLGLILVLVFGATGLGLLPVVGLSNPDLAAAGAFERGVDLALHLCLPVATLTLGGVAFLTRQVRDGMLETLGQDFVLAARARGLPERRVVWNHALRNALGPVIALSGAVLPAMVGGSIVVETVFQIPGMGRYAYEGLLERDPHIVIACTTLSAWMTLIGLLLADFLHRRLDPRLRHG